MSSKENIISLLKELEQEIIALEEEVIKKTENEVHDTISEFTYTIKNEARKVDMEMGEIRNKLNSFSGDNRQATPIPTLKVVPLT